MIKIMLNMHSRVIFACLKFRYTCMHAFALCTCICAQILTKIFLVVHYSAENLSFKFLLLINMSCVIILSRFEETRKNKAFAGLGSCDNAQTERSIFEYANWPWLQIKRTAGPSSWSVQVVRQAGPYSWSV